MRNMKTTIILILTVVFATALFAGCSGGGAGGAESVGDEVSNDSAAEQQLTVKIDGQEEKFDASSGWLNHSTFTYSKDGESATSSSTTIVLANFEIETKWGISTINKSKAEKPGNIKIYASILGEKGTTGDTPIKAGDYPAVGDIFNKIRGVSIYHSKDGKEKETELEEDSMKGKITIKSVEGKTITGEIDVTDGENSVKGSFMAKARGRDE